MSAEVGGRHPSARAWITGARGFIGRHLARYLSGGGAAVAGLGRGAWPDARDWGVSNWVAGEVAPAALDRLADAAGAPDVIYHLAGGASVGRSFEEPRRDFERTVVATADLLDWMRARAPAARLVAVSSAAVYGDGHAGPIAEGAPLAPYSPYGAHKFAMEQLCRGWGGAYGLEIVVVRLFSVYGPELAKQLLWDLCGKLARGDGGVTLGGSGDELRDWTHVDDVVRALAAAVALAGPQVPVVNAGRGEGVDVRAIAGQVARAFGRDAGCIAFSGDKRSGDPFSLIADPTMLARTGFEWRVALGEGIAGYVAWYRAQHDA